MFEEQQKSLELAVGPVRKVPFVPAATSCFQAADGNISLSMQCWCYHTMKNVITLIFNTKKQTADFQGSRASVIETFV